MSKEHAAASQEPIPSLVELAEIDSELKSIEGRPMNYIFENLSNQNIDTDDILSLHFIDLPKIIKFNTREKDTELAKRIASGDSGARDELFFSVVYLIFYEARKRTDTRSLWPDLLQEGYLAVWEKAIPKFDPEKGKFSTYATWWIRQRQKLMMYKTKRINNISRNTNYEINKLEKEYYAFLAKTGREPTDRELARKMKIPAKDLEKVKIVANQKTLLFSIEIGNLDNDKVELGETIKDEDALSGTELEDLIDGRILRDEVIREVMALENPRYKQLLMLRFGIDGDGLWTKPGLALEEVGQEMKVTRERIRQLQRVAISKLQNSRIRRVATNYLGDKQRFHRSQKDKNTP